MRQSPCKTCDKHEATCHTNCEDYEDWKAELNEYNRAVRANREAERKLAFDDYTRRKKRK